MKLHKLAKLFPKVTGPDFKALVLDIKTNGLRQPITTLGGLILDSQRAAIAAELATNKGSQKGGAPTESEGVSAAQAARALKVTKRAVQQAKKVKRELPSAFKKVKSGEMTLNAAHEKKHPRKPLPRGGLAAQMRAIEHGNGHREPVAAAPITSRTDPSQPVHRAWDKASEPGVEVACLYVPHIRSQEPDKLTLKLFRIESEALAARAEAAAGDQAEREKFGVIANDVLVKPFMNRRQKAATFNPYGR